MEKIGIVTIDSQFKATKEEVICNYISHHSKIACFQIEISEKIRLNNQLMINLLQQLEIIIKDLCKYKFNDNQEFKKIL